MNFVIAGLHVVLYTLRVYVIDGVDHLCLDLFDSVSF